MSEIARYDITGAHGQSSADGLSDPYGTDFYCGSGSTTQPCYLLAIDFYGCYLPGQADQRHGQWACVNDRDSDGHPRRVDHYADAWNALPCEAALKRAGLMDEAILLSSV